MYITNVTDYDKMTDDYNNTLLSNCTNNEKNIVINIPTSFFNKTMWSIFSMFNELDGIHISETFIKKKIGLCQIIRFLFY